MVNQSLSICPHCKGEYRNVLQHIKYVHPEYWEEPPKPAYTNVRKTALTPFEELKTMLKDQNEMLMLMALRKDLLKGINDTPQKDNNLELFEKLQNAQRQAIQDERERIKAIKAELQLEPNQDDDYGDTLIKSIIGGAINANTTRTNTEPNTNSSGTQENQPANAGTIRINQRHTRPDEVPPPVEPK